MSTLLKRKLVLRSITQSRALVALGSVQHGAAQPRHSICAYAAGRGGRHQAMAHMYRITSSYSVDVLLQIARAGDIVALGGLKDVITGETLCDENKPLLLERMEFPEPVIKVGVRLTSAAPVLHQCRRLPLQSSIKPL